MSGAIQVESRIPQAGTAIESFDPGTLSDLAVYEAARLRPRNEDLAIGKLLGSCRRPTFAPRAYFRFPRGLGRDGTPNYIEGPSVLMLREAKRVFGNMESGFHVLHRDTERVVVRGYAVDFETNARTTSMMDGRLVQQRKRGKSTVWETIESERDILELIARLGSKAERNAIKGLLPIDLVDEALSVAMETDAQRVDDEIRKGPEEFWRDVCGQAARYRITPAMLLHYAGAEEFADLIGDIKALTGLGQAVRAVRLGEARASELFDFEAGRPTPPPPPDSGRSKADRIADALGADSEPEASDPGSEASEPAVDASGGGPSAYSTDQTATGEFDSEPACAHVEDGPMWTDGDDRGHGGLATAQPGAADEPEQPAEDSDLPPGLLFDPGKALWRQAALKMAVSLFRRYPTTDPLVEMGRALGMDGPVDIPTLSPSDWHRLQVALRGTLEQ